MRRKKFNNGSQSEEKGGCNNALINSLSISIDW